ncbi:MAG: DUF4838 domain-containing protein, partial [Verrucomicrobiaceae bacterium]
SHADGLRLVGATPAGLENAVWDLLHRLGHRQFFPGETWEVVPAEKNLAIDVDVVEKPAFLSRRIWYGFGNWPESKGSYQDWCAKNRARESVKLNTGHAYDQIIRRNAATLAEHPEYLALVGGVRKGAKLCVSNPGLRKMVVDDALATCAKNPAADSISMDPSDGGGWCECDGCAKLGSVSDQALTLANEVAAAIQPQYPGRLVGIYAYNFHSPPPSIRVHPQVVVSVATAFIKGGSTLDELISGWAAKGAKLGIREYYSVNTWDRDLPGAARGGNPAYLARTIPEFSKKGATFLSSEASNNWGPNGLGYYLAARMLWDPAEAADVEKLTEDFLTRAFGPAKEPMREFYRQLDGALPHLVRADQLGRMFRSLEQAGKTPGVTPQIRARLDALTLYARYVHLFERYSKAEGTQRRQAFETLIRHAYRMRDTGMVHSYGLYRDLAARDKSVKIPDGAKFNVPEGKNPWKSSAPFATEELAAFLKEGIAGNPLSDISFKPVAWSQDLVGVSALHPPDAPAGELGAGRGKQTFFTRIGEGGGAIGLRITGGLIKHYRDRGNVKLSLWKIGGESETGEKETLVTEDRSVPPDGEPHAVTLEVRQPGLYRLEMDDGRDRTLVEPLHDLPWTVESSDGRPMNGNHGQWRQYFYVPRGTAEIGFFGGDHGEIRDSADRPLFWLNGREPNYYSVEVPEGQDGKFWSVRYGRGAVRLFTVPPYFATTPAKLLLPREVVDKDGAK